jgi:hypothetical protein
MRHLPLQVGQLHRVVVDDADGADAGGGQIQHQRRAEPTGAHHQHARRLQPGLTEPAHLLQQDMAGVAADFVFREIEVHAHRIGSHGRQAKGVTSMKGRT